MFQEPATDVNAMQLRESEAQASPAYTVSFTIGDETRIYDLLHDPHVTVMGNEVTLTFTRTNNSGNL